MYAYTYILVCRAYVYYILLSMCVGYSCMRVLLYLGIFFEKYLKVTGSFIASEDDYRDKKQVQCIIRHFVIDDKSETIIIRAHIN